MNWLLLAAVVCGLGGLTVGAIYAAQNANFWIGLLAVMAKAALPAITKQMTPVELDEWHKANRQGNGDQYMQEHLKKKLKPIFGRKP